MCGGSCILGDGVGVWRGEHHPIETSSPNFLVSRSPGTGTCSLETSKEFSLNFTINVKFIKQYYKGG